LFEGCEDTSIRGLKEALRSIFGGKDYMKNLSSAIAKMTKLPVDNVVMIGAYLNLVKGRKGDLNFTVTCKAKETALGRQLLFLGIMNYMDPDNCQISYVYDSKPHYQQPTVSSLSHQAQRSSTAASASKC
jgi:hypothetical protein